jgi:hypothetical protein
MLEYSVHEELSALKNDQWETASALSKFGYVELWKQHSSLLRPLLLIIKDQGILNQETGERQNTRLTLAAASLFMDILQLLMRWADLKDPLELAGGQLANAHAEMEEKETILSMFYQGLPYIVEFLQALKQVR